MKRTFVLFAFGLFACADAGDLTVLDLDEPQKYFATNFVELTPPIRLPTPTRIFLSLPKDARIETRFVREDAAPLLSFPPGAVLERVDTHEDTIADVRGTRIGEDGRFYFHNYRPSRTHRGLAGVEWPATDHDRLSEQVAGQLAARTRVDRRSILKKNGCPSCHAAGLEETAARLVRRGTDASGFYVPQYVLSDVAPLERYGDPQLSLADPFVRVSCSGGEPAPCADGSLARATYDLESAISAGSSHAAAVCASRRFLVEHLDERGREWFREALAPCTLK